MIALGPVQFASPLWLLLLLLLPAWWLLARRRKPAAIVFSRVAVLARGPRAGRWLSRTLAVLRNLALALGIVALARPRSGARAETSNSEGINIVIAFDISSSMLAQDFKPQNRLEVARERVKAFVAARSNDRIGLVAFSGEALTQVPLTTDYPVVQAALDNLQPGQLDDGTAIGTAIATAANRLKDAPGKSRVLVLLTDGVNNRGSIDPRTAAKAAAQFGIRIYGIGVGSEGMAPVPVGPRAVRPPVRDAACRDRRRAPHRHRARDRRPLLPGARPGRPAAHHGTDRCPRADPGAQPHLRAVHGALSLAPRPDARHDGRGAGAARVEGAAAMTAALPALALVELPWALPLAVVLPLLFVFLLHRSRRQRVERLRRLGALDVVRRLVPATAFDGSAWRVARIGAAAALAGLALAGPRWGHERETVTTSGVDLVLAVDASLSMLATDEKPSRLERVKQEIRRLRTLSPGDRVGLLAFAGRSYVLTPVTVDGGALDLFLDNLDPSVVGQAGTSLAATIAQGTSLLSLTKSGADQKLGLRK